MRRWLIVMSIQVASVLCAYNAHADEFPWIGWELINPHDGGRVKGFSFSAKNGFVLHGIIHSDHASSGYFADGIRTRNGNLSVGSPADVSTSNIWLLSKYIIIMHSLFLEKNGGLDGQIESGRLPTVPNFNFKNQFKGLSP